MPATRTFIALTAAALVTAAAPLAGAGAAQPRAAVQFACQVEAKNHNRCDISIPLTSNMNEQIGSTMPDSSPWYNWYDGGSVGTGGYTLSGPGNPLTSWNGSSANLSGTVWAAQLSTGTVTAGAYASLGFEHVHNQAAPKPYTSISASYPTIATTGSVVTVSAVVRPVPPKGHVVLQRLQGTAWKNVVGATYSAATKKWTARFRWAYPKHTSKRFRIDATAAPGLLATAGGPFTISTLG